MLELTVLYLGLSVSFAILTGLVLRKSRNISNLAFTVTTSLFSLNTFASFLQELMKDAVIPPSDLFSIILRIIGDFAYLIAPLGLAYSSFTIIYGYNEWKNKYLTIFTLFYMIFGFLFIAANEPFIPTIDEDQPNPFLNLLISIPLLISLFYFGRLYQEVEEEKLKVFLLESGVFIGTSGQLLNTLSVFLDMGTSPIALLIIIIGVILASISFTNLSGTVSDTSEQAATSSIAV